VLVRQGFLRTSTIRENSLTVTSRLIATDRNQPSSRTPKGSRHVARGPKSRRRDDPGKRNERLPQALKGRRQILGAVAYFRSTLPPSLASRESRNPTVLIWSIPTKSQMPGPGHWSPKNGSQSRRTHLVNSHVVAVASDNVEVRLKRVAIPPYSSGQFLHGRRCNSCNLRRHEKSQSHRTHLVNSHDAVLALMAMSPSPSASVAIPPYSSGQLTQSH
jgi:hypothetical protein